MAPDTSNHTVNFRASNLKVADLNVCFKVDGVWRVRLGVWLIRLGAKIAGCSVAWLFDGD